jgi:ketosteroid isomerase-like protein
MSGGIVRIHLKLYLVAMLVVFAAPCFGIVCCAALLFAQDSSKRSGEEGRLLALESAWNHAEQSKDAGALNQLLGDSFSYVDYDGTFMDKKQFLDSTLHNSVEQEQINNDGMAVRVFGNAAAVTGVYRDKGIEKGKPFSRRGRFTDTWIYQNGVWQCVASQSTLTAH